MPIILHIQKKSLTQTVSEQLEAWFSKAKEMFIYKQTEKKQNDWAEKT